MTLQMAIGRLIVQKIVGQPEKYPQEVVTDARQVIENFYKWPNGKQQFSHRDDFWHEKSISWNNFRATAAHHNIDLPAILQGEEKQ